MAVRRDSKSIPRQARIGIDGDGDKVLRENEQAE